MRATTEKGFVQKIRARMKQVNTYRPEFQITIERLAKIYMRILHAEDQFEKSGGNTIVKKTTARGTSWEKNPLLVEIDDLNKNALELERELGLTPASLRRVNEAAMPQGVKAEEDPLAAALGRLHAI